MPKQTSDPYQRIRARLDQLYGPSFSDRAASLAVTKGRNPDLIRNIKRGASRLPKAQDLVDLAEFLQKPVAWLTSPDGDEEPAEDPTSERAIIRRTAEARARSGMTIDTISRLLHVTPIEYTRFESVVPIYPKLVARFCVLTGVSADWLFSGQERTREEEEVSGPNILP